MLCDQNQKKEKNKIKQSLSFSLSAYSTYCILWIAFSVQYNLCVALNPYVSKLIISTNEMPLYNRCNIFSVIVLLALSKDKQTNNVVWKFSRISLKWTMGNYSNGNFPSRFIFDSHRLDASQVCFFLFAIFFISLSALQYKIHFVCVWVCIIMQCNEALYISDIFYGNVIWFHLLLPAGIRANILIALGLLYGANIECTRQKKVSTSSSTLADDCYRWWRRWRWWFCFGGNFRSRGEHLIELWFYLRIPRGINSNK